MWHYIIFIDERGSKSKKPFLNKTRRLLVNRSVGNYAELALGTSPSFLQIRYARLHSPSPPLATTISRPPSRAACSCTAGCPGTARGVSLLPPCFVAGVRSSVRQTGARVFVAFSSLCKHGEVPSCRFLCDCCSLPFKYSIKCLKGVRLLILHVRCLHVFVDHLAHKCGKGFQFVSVLYRVVVDIGVHVQEEKWLMV